MGRLPASALVAGGAILLALGLGTDGRAASGWERVRALMLGGDRAAARAVADSLIALVDEDGKRPVEGEFLRALLEEDGMRAEERMRALHGDDVPDRLEAELHMRLGRDAFAGGRFLEALEFFDEARKLGRNEEGSLWGGLAARALGDPAAARARLEAAAGSGNARIRPRAVLALAGMARDAGRYAEAIALYGRVEAEGMAGEPGWVGAAIWGHALCARAEGRAEDERLALEDLLERVPGAYEAPLARERLRALTAPPAVPESAPAEAEAPAEPEAPAAGEAFAVQVGAFSQRENADSFARRFTEAGFPARVETVEPGLHRVLVGRFPDRAAAEAEADSLAELAPTGYSIVALPGKR